jgi:hypothetical protein
MYQSTNDGSYSDVNGGNSIQFSTEIACGSTMPPDTASQLLPACTNVRTDQTYYKIHTQIILLE